MADSNSNDCERRPLSAEEKLLRIVSIYGFSACVVVFLVSSIGALDDFGMPSRSPFVEIYFLGLIIYLGVIVTRFALLVQIEGAVKAFLDVVALVFLLFAGLLILAGVMSFRM